MDPLALAPAYSNNPDKPALKVGSVAELGIEPSTYIQDQQQLEINTVDSDSDADADNESSLKRPPSTNLADMQEQAQSALALDFHACNEHAPEIDPCLTALAALDAAFSEHNAPEEISKYLPEPQSFQAVLRLDESIRRAWLHAIRLKIKNLIDNKTFILNEHTQKGELVVPVKLVLKAKQTANGQLEKLKARLVARGDYQKRRMKKNARILEKAKTLQKDMNYKAALLGTPAIKIELPPQPDEDTWSPNASARALKLFLAVMTAARRTVKSADFIGAYLQANMVGRHFVRLPREYAEYFPEYEQYFGVPLTNYGWNCLARNGRTF
jgi:hypothetical protein